MAELEAGGALDKSVATVSSSRGHHHEVLGESIAAATLDPTATAFTMAVLGVGGDALSAGGRAVGDGVLELTHETATAVHALLAQAEDVVDEHPEAGETGGTSAIATTFETHKIALTVVASTSEAPGAAPAMEPPDTTAFPLQLTGMPTAAIVSLSSSTWSDGCNGRSGISLALMEQDPYGSAFSAATEAYFGGVVSVRGLCFSRAGGTERGRRLLGNGADSHRDGGDGGDGVNDDGDGATLYFNASFPARGGGMCNASSRVARLFGLADPSDDTCSGGICCGGVCVCERGFYGAFCEVHVDCGTWEPALSRWDNRSCSLVGLSVDPGTPGRMDGEEPTGGGWR